MAEKLYLRKAENNDFTFALKLCNLYAIFLTNKHHSESKSAYIKAFFKGKKGLKEVQNAIKWMKKTDKMLNEKGHKNKDHWQKKVIRPSIRAFEKISTSLTQNNSNDAFSGQSNSMHNISAKAQYELATRLEKQGKYEKAIFWLEKAQKQKHQQALELLAKIFSKNWPLSLTPNYIKLAEETFLEGANEGNISYACHLCKLYHSIVKDYNNSPDKRSQSTIALLAGRDQVDVLNDAIKWAKDSEQWPEKKYDEDFLFVIRQYIKDYQKTIKSIESGRNKNIPQKINKQGAKK